jgi:hypothetical protein
MEGLTKEHLLQTLLAWYGNNSNWALPPRKAGVALAIRKSVMELDKGRCARTALSEDTVGNLLKAVCDAYGIHLMELGRRAELPDPLTGEIVRGANLRPEVSVRLRQALDEMVKRNGQ